MEGGIGGDTPEISEIDTGIPADRQPQSEQAARALTRPSSGALVTAVLVAPSLIALGASDGGYFPNSWGWSALVFAWAAMLALVIRETIVLSRLEMVYVGSLTAFITWTAFSLLWTTTVAGTVLEIQRTLVYVTFAIAIAVIVGRAEIPVLLGSVLVAISALSLYGLATRLFPGRLTEYDTFVTYRLSEPLGYWNTVAGLTALGMVLATAFAARARLLLVRGLAASAVVVLFPTFYFTFGRGGWLALFAGLLVTFALDPRRLQYVAAALPVAPWVGVALWRSHAAEGMTTDFSPIATATNDGKQLAWTLALLSLGAFVTSVAFGAAERRVTISRRGRTAFSAALALAAAALIALAVVHYDGPAEIIRDARASLKQSSPNVRGDQTQRLLSLSPNGRFDLWRVAIDAARAHPVNGIGAGAYEQRWNRERPLPAQVRDAHSVVFETAGELGLVGLGLLCLVLLIPLIVAVRARSHPLVPAAAGCLAGYVVHSAVDWDWEMPVLTLAALTCAAAVLVAGREASATLSLGRGARWASVVVLAAAGVVALVGLVGNRALAQADDAAALDKPAAVVDHAKTAARWAPWSSAPLQFRADVALEAGKTAEAAALYLAAIEKDRTNWELWLGLALSTTGARQRAALAEAERLNPLSTEIRQLHASGL